MKQKRSKRARSVHRKPTNIKPKSNNNNNNLLHKSNKNSTSKQAAVAGGGKPSSRRLVQEIKGSYSKRFKNKKEQLTPWIGSLLATALQGKPLDLPRDLRPRFVQIVGRGNPPMEEQERLEEQQQQQEQQRNVEKDERKTLSGNKRKRKSSSTPKKDDKNSKKDKNTSKQQPIVDWWSTLTPTIHGKQLSRHDKNNNDTTNTTNTTNQASPPPPHPGCCWKTVTSHCPYIEISDGETSIRAYLSKSCQEDLQMLSQQIDVNMECTKLSWVVIENYRIIAFSNQDSSSTKPTTTATSTITTTGTGTSSKRRARSSTSTSSSSAAVSYWLPRTRGRSSKSAFTIALFVYGTIRPKGKVVVTSNEDLHGKRCLGVHPLLIHPCELNVNVRQAIQSFYATSPNAAASSTSSSSSSTSTLDPQAIAQHRLYISQNPPQLLSSVQQDQRDNDMETTRSTIEAKSPPKILQQDNTADDNNDKRPAVQAKISPKKVRKDKDERPRIETKITRKEEVQKDKDGDDRGNDAGASKLHGTLEKAKQKQDDQATAKESDKLKSPSRSRESHDKRPRLETKSPRKEEVQHDKDNDGGASKLHGTLEKAKQKRDDQATAQESDKLKSPSRSRESHDKRPRIETKSPRKEEVQQDKDNDGGASKLHGTLEKAKQKQDDQATAKESDKLKSPSRSRESHLQMDGIDVGKQTIDRQDKGHQLHSKSSESSNRTGHEKSQDNQGIQNMKSKEGGQRNDEKSESSNHEKEEDQGKVNKSDKEVEREINNSGSIVSNHSSADRDEKGDRQIEGNQGGKKGGLADSSSTLKVHNKHGEKPNTTANKLEEKQRSNSDDMEVCTQEQMEPTKEKVCTQEQMEPTKEKEQDRTSCSDSFLTQESNPRGATLQNPEKELATTTPSKQNDSNIVERDETSDTIATTSVPATKELATLDLLESQPPIDVAGNTNQDTVRRKSSGDDASSSSSTSSSTLLPPPSSPQQARATASSVPPPSIPLGNVEEILADVTKWDQILELAAMESAKEKQLSEATTHCKEHGYEQPTQEPHAAVPMACTTGGNQDQARDTSMQRAVHKVCPTQNIAPVADLSKNMKRSSKTRVRTTQLDSSDDESAKADEDHGTVAMSPMDMGINAMLPMTPSPVRGTQPLDSSIGSNLKSSTHGDGDKNDTNTNDNGVPPKVFAELAVPGASMPIATTDSQSEPLRIVSTSTMIRNMIRQAQGLRKWLSFNVRDKESK